MNLHAFGLDITKHFFCHFRITKLVAIKLKQVHTEGTFPIHNVCSQQVQIIATIIGYLMLARPRPGFLRSTQASEGTDNTDSPSRYWNAFYRAGR